MPCARTPPGFTQCCLLCPSQRHETHRGPLGPPLPKSWLALCPPTPGQEGSRGQDGDLTRVCLTLK